MLFQKSSEKERNYNRKEEHVRADVETLILLTRGLTQSPNE